jgi:hypothetical protein
VDDDQLRNLLANLPERLSRSRLEPYRKLIAALRRRGRPYREIAQILEDKCELHVSPAAVHHFVRLHLRRDCVRQARQMPGTATRNQISLPAGIDQVTASTHLKVQPKTDEEIWRRIAELKGRPPVTELSEKQFHYDQDQPLHLVQNVETNKCDAGQ